MEGVSLLNASNGRLEGWGSLDVGGPVEFLIWKSVSPLETAPMWVSPTQHWGASTSLLSIHWGASTPLLSIHWGVSTFWSKWYQHLNWFTKKLRMPHTSESQSVFSIGESWLLGEFDVANVFADQFWSTCQCIHHRGFQTLRRGGKKIKQQEAQLIKAAVGTN